MNLSDKIRARATAQADALAAWLDAIESDESRTDKALTADEQAHYDAELRQVEDAYARADQTAELEVRQAAAAERTAQIVPEERAVEHRPAVVTSEPRTYTAESEHSFLLDAYRAEFAQDYDARGRIDRHMTECRVEGETRGLERRATTTSAYTTGLIVPAYLSALFAPYARAGRPLANAITRLPLPDTGMTAYVPRITTGATTAIQATENSAASSTDQAATLLSVPVVTIAGQQQVSRQSLERGILVEQILMRDLVAAYAANLDSQAINGSGSSGQVLGILNTSGIATSTYTSASPTVGGAFPKIADVMQQIAVGRFLGADTIFMHPRRWGWFTAALDSSNRPLIIPQALNFMSEDAAMNPVGIGDGTVYGQVVGNILGMKVITDGNIPTNLGAGTNEDRIIVARTSELFLWESSDMPLQFRFDQPLGNQLSVQFVVYGYAAFTAGRTPLSSGVISGTGLVTPTF